MEFNEEWKDVIGFEGAYQVSNLGRVRSLDRTVEYINHGTPTKMKIFGRILKLTPDPEGYLQVGLKFGKKVKSTGVHRLVAQAFLPNPNNLPCVNHKDYQRDNNHVDNLEWCSVEYNNHYSENQDRRPHSMYVRCGKLAGKKIGRKVKCIQTGQVFDTMSAAEKELGLWASAVIYSLDTGRPVGKKKYTFECLGRNKRTKLPNGI